MRHTFLGHQLKSHVMNAAGVHCTTLDELSILLKNTKGLIVTKTATLHPRQGNIKPRYAEIPGGSINSMGLPNLGIDAYINFITLNSMRAHRIILSIAGLSLNELIRVAHRANCSKALAIEVNLSCPNIDGKPQVAYDFQTTEYLLKQLGIIFDKPWGVKLPPYFDPIHFDQITELLNRSSVSFVTAINSPGNALWLDEDLKSVIVPKDGHGGIGGPMILPIALANVSHLRKRLRPEIEMIGCGGVETALDVKKHMKCGAQIVQVGTTLMKYGPHLLNELSASV